jgi:hypothetical protein
MNRLGHLPAVALAIMLATASAANAQAPLDMKGTWTFAVQSVIDGDSPHHPSSAPTKPAGKYKLRSTTFTYVVEGQDGGNFWGSYSSDTRAGDRLLGSLSVDGKRVNMVARSGILEGVVVDANTLDICFRNVQSGGEAVVGCGLFKRKM